MHVRAHWEAHSLDSSSDPNALRFINVHHLTALGCNLTHLSRIDGPGIELLAFPVHTQHSWLHNTVLVRLEKFVIGVHCYLGFNKILFLQVVAQGVSGVREALNMRKRWKKE